MRLTGGREVSKSCDYQFYKIDFSSSYIQTHKSIARGCQQTSVLLNLSEYYRCILSFSLFIYCGMSVWHKYLPLQLCITKESIKPSNTTTSALRVASTFSESLFNNEKHPITIILETDCFLAASQHSKEKERENRCSFFSFSVIKKRKQ